MGYPAGRSEELQSFLNRLFLGQYTNFEGLDNFSLRGKGVELLEEMVLQSFIDDPELTQRFARDAGLELNPILQKNLKKYCRFQCAILR